MVAHYASSRVPRFASLIDFMRAKKLCLRALYTERQKNFIRHKNFSRQIIQPDYFTIQIAFKQQNQTFGRHIRLT